MTDQHSAHNDNAEKSTPADILAGTRVLAFSCDAHLTLSWAENLPNGLLISEFAALLRDCPIEAVSTRTISDAVRAVAESGIPFAGFIELDVPGAQKQYELTLRLNEEGCVVGVAVDVTGRARGEDAVRILSLELAHRTKNLMAVVSSLAEQTAKRAADVAEFRARFQGQIHALSRAHDTIAATGWFGATVRDIVEMQIAKLLTDVTIEMSSAAEAVTVAPNAAQHLAMVVHELIVSCGRSGTLMMEAIVAPEGHLEIVCRLHNPDNRAQLWDVLLIDVAPLAMGGIGRIDETGTDLVYSLSIGADQFVEQQP